MIDFKSMEIGQKTYLPDVRDWKKDAGPYYEAAQALTQETGAQFSFDHDKINPQECSWWVERVR